ncbi:hypothetical protein ACFQZC_13250 [Streptacidiphilus monticola]
MLNDLLRRRRSARRASTGALELSAVFPTLSWGGVCSAANSGARTGNRSPAPASR